MRAVAVQRFGGPEELRAVEWPDPDPGPGEVRIRVLWTSVNFADIKARHGRYHAGGAPPFVPGLDALGVVDKVGPGVADLAVGARVIAFVAAGSYAEYAIADRRLVFGVPEGVADEDAAACPVVGLTAYKLLHDVARIEPGETVLVHAAAGGVGTTAAQLAKLLGASKVVGTVGSEAKTAAAREAGVDTVVDYTVPSWPDVVNHLTSGRGVDVVLDSVAGSVTDASMRCLARFGRLVNFGDAAGETGRVRTVDLHGSCRSVLGFSLGTTRRERPTLLEPAARAVLGYLAHGALHMRIGARFDLEEAGAAQAWVESRASTGKVLIRVTASG